MAQDRKSKLFWDRPAAERDALNSFQDTLQGGSRTPVRRGKQEAPEAPLPEVGARLRRVIDTSSVSVPPVNPVPPAAPVVSPVVPPAPRVPAASSSRFPLFGCLALALGSAGAVGLGTAYGVYSNLSEISSSRQTDGWYQPPAPEEESTPELPVEISPSSTPPAEVPTVVEPAVPEANVEVIELTDASFDSFIENAKGPVVVDFYATWCAPCKVLSPKLDKAAATYVGKITFVRVDVDKCKKTNAKYNIQFMPTLAAIKGGKEASRVVGPSDPELEAFLDSLIK